MADDDRSTNSSLTGCVPPSVTSCGGELVALIRVRDRVSIVPSRYLTDWGVRDAKNLLDHSMSGRRRRRRRWWRRATHARPDYLINTFTDTNLTTLPIIATMTLTCNSRTETTQTWRIIQRKNNPARESSSATIILRGNDPAWRRNNPNEKKRRQPHRRLERTR